MAHLDDFELARSDPEALEALYQRAKRENWADEFAAETTRRHSDSPEDVLMAAWWARLRPASTAAPEARSARWGLAAPFSLGLSLVFWLMTPSLNQATPGVPTVILLWAPAAACAIIAFLMIASRWGASASSGQGAVSLVRSAVAILVVVLAAAYAVWQGALSKDTYGILMGLHLPLLSFLGVGLSVASPADDRAVYATFRKAVEAAIAGGLLGGAAGVFVGITMGLFAAIGVSFPEPVQRWLTFGVAGLVPVLAVALTYDPTLAPLRQRIDEGIAGLLSAVARLFLPLTIVVGALYIASIPFNFFRPFEQRDVLIVYNAMLFAVMALLAIATPLREGDVPDRWRSLLGSALLVIAVMTVVVSLYALSATTYRTFLGGLTPNRLTVIGWNVLNVAILCLYLVRRVLHRSASWIPDVHFAFRVGMIGYAVWGLFVAVIVPILFR